ncbi:MAG: arsenite methyltransferase, partial [Candidatus Latescibacterota bacterium]
MNKDDQTTKDTVREAYGKIAQGGGSCCGSSCCCGSGAENSLSSSLEYTAEELAGLPEGADMGLSCGNPFLVDSLAQGETVLDLGCGGGFDVFIAARKVGDSGRVIGVDMTPDMISLSRKNAAKFTELTGLSNVDIRLGEIEHLPVADNSVDVVISNCVINLSTDKPQVWREVTRALNPGGRVAISDIALLKPLPETLRSSIEAYVGCIAGAVLLEDTKDMMKDSGLTNISTRSHSNYIDAMAGSGDPLYR